MTNLSQLLSVFNNSIFRQLYVAQTISLLGDALTWLGLGLLAFALAKENSSIVLATALTIRVTTFIILAPIAGVVADRFDRKPILTIAHLGRMVLVCCLPFVREIWQIYALVFGLNIFNAFFTPTYQATIPLVTNESERPLAIALSTITSQIIGVFGSGMAGVLALFIGERELFFWDGLSFAIAAISIFSLPRQLVANSQASQWGWENVRSDLQIGTLKLWKDPPVRYGLMLQLVAAIAGGEILVNTVGYVRGSLNQTSVQYGWVMMGFGLGATLGATIVGIYPQLRSRLATLIGGSIAIVAVLLPANYVNLATLIVLWTIAGCGQSLIGLSLQTLIADRTPTHLQGRVYGAHFAWSHLWWMGAYPLAGWLGNTFPDRYFSYAGLLGFGLLLIIHLSLVPDRFPHTHTEFWHSHETTDTTANSDHDREHSSTPNSGDTEGIHSHENFSHIHAYGDISHQHDR
jgi:MFS transporter, NRE family, putaive nickel resistance protein